jgi:hypothetical protein
MLFLIASTVKRVNKGHSRGRPKMAFGDTGGLYLEVTLFFLINEGLV